MRCQIYRTKSAPQHTHGFAIGVPSPVTQPSLKARDCSTAIPVNNLLALLRQGGFDLAHLQHHRTEAGHQDYEEHRSVAEQGPSLEVNTPVATIHLFQYDMTQLDAVQVALTGRSTQQRR